MGRVSTLVTPGGEELVVLPRAEYETLVERAAELSELREAASAFAAADAGRDAGMSAADVEAYAASPSPLAFWLTRRGMTQAQLAARTGLSQAFVSKLAAGKTGASAANLKAVAAELGVDVDALID
jgi:predicted XRE-type DNA-binding protein